VLTAGALLQPGADYKMVELWRRTAHAENVESVAIHPAFQDGCDVWRIAPRPTSPCCDLMRRRKEIRRRLALQTFHRGREPFHGRPASGHRARDGKERRHYPVSRACREPQAGHTCKSGWSIRQAKAPRRTRRCTGDSSVRLFRGQAKRRRHRRVVSWSTGPERRFGLRRNDRRDTLTLYSDWILQTGGQWVSPVVRCSSTCELSCMPGDDR